MLKNKFYKVNDFIIIKIKRNTVKNLKWKN